MAFYRQLLVLTVPSVAVLFGIYWYRRKRGCANSDPGGNTRSTKTLKEELEEATSSEAKPSPISPTKSIAKSAPIDIVANGVHSQRTSPVRLTDKELDYEIEKAKSHKFYDMDHPIQKSCQENIPASERRVKSLPAKPTLTQNNINTSYSVKRDINTDCLLNHKVKEETSSPGRKTEHRHSSPMLSTVSPVREVIQEELRKEEATSVLMECPSPKTNTNEKLNKTSRKSRKQTKETKAEKTDSTVMEVEAADSEISSLVSVEKCAHSVTVKVGDKLDHRVSTDSGAVEVETRPVDRDSANHSPADAMLASPCISNFSDNHSEVSTPLFLTSLF